MNHSAYLTWKFPVIGLAKCQVGQSIMLSIAEWIVLTHTNVQYLHGVLLLRQYRIARFSAVIYIHRAFTMCGGMLLFLVVYSVKRRTQSIPSTGERVQHEKMECSLTLNKVQSAVTLGIFFLTCCKQTLQKYVLS